MQIRRPLTALLTALALFGGGATLTACGDWGPATPNEGTTDGDSDNTGGNDRGDEDQGDLPDNSNRATEQELDDDLSDPD